MSKEVKRSHLNNLVSLKKENKIKNIYIFISDAVRWDYTPSYFKKQGLCFKTIAAGVHTPVSVPTILTGLNPNNHGFFKLSENTLSKSFYTLLDVEGYDICYPGKRIYPIWDENKRGLEEMDPPFIYIEHDHGGHSPYGRKTELSSKDFYEKYYSKTCSDLKKVYKKGVKKSINVFEERLQTLSENNLLQETLVIFLSDHGELLGEYGGLLNHGWVILPELVYVPTIFFHPDLPKMEINDEYVFRHVDIFPTIMDILGESIDQYIDGGSVLKSGFHDKGMTYHKRVKYSWKENPIEKSVWDSKGGHIFRDFKNMQRLECFIKYTFMMMFEDNYMGSYIRSRLKRKNPVSMYKDIWGIEKLFNMPYVEMREPSFTKQTAKEYLEKNIKDMSEKIKLDKALKNII